MKILAIMGSPRLGDSYKITKIVEENLIKHKDVDFEYVFLKDRNIGMCRGCFLCVRKGAEYCPVKDDVQDILLKMKQADGIIFTSPVYALSITGLMKTFKDRTAYNAHRPAFFGKKAMAVATSEGTGLSDTIKLIKTWQIWGMEFVSELKVNIHPTLTPKDTYLNALNKSIETASEKLYEKIIANKTKKPGFIQLVQFRVLKYMSEIGKEGFPADYEYYKTKDRFHYETKVSKFKSFMAKLFTRMAAGFMRKNYILSGEK